MSLQEQQNLLARLYTDAEFRRAFLSEPEKIGAENDLTAGEIREIAAIMPEELDFFADSLFWKRLREVEKFLPLTRKILGEDFAGHFREFSRKYNPQTIKKHFEDALEFTRFLRLLDLSAPAGSAVKYEQAKLLFFGLEKRLVICRLEYDHRKEIPEKRKLIAVWLRIGKRVRNFYL